MSVQEQIAFTFKKISPQEVPQLVAWFKEPHVAQWWPAPGEDEKIIEHFLARIRSKDTFGYLVFKNEFPLGYIQYYYIDRMNPKTGAWLPEGLLETTVGIDQFIGDSQCLGKGYGTSFIKEFITYLRDLEPQITTVIVDPELVNNAAIRCYEKVGFKKVGEYTTPWGSALLMRYDVR